MKGNDHHDPFESHPLMLTVVTIMSVVSHVLCIKISLLALCSGSSQCLHRIEASDCSSSASNGKSHMGATDPEMLFCWNRSVFQAIVSAMTKCLSTL